jgi:ABC-type transport system substrate-binding protein
MNEYPGWWSDEEALAAAAELLQEGEFDVRYPIWESIQEMAYTQIPAIKIGDSSISSFRSERLGGWTETFQRGEIYWNFWLNG